MAGFRSPGFPLGLSATPVVQTYGFRTVLPFFSAGRGIVDPPVPEEVGGVGLEEWWPSLQERRGSDDDEIMAIIISFMGVINGR